jgi:putative ABC transport system permease protein
MIKNYFKIAWRNLWKNKIFSAINIFGLAVGMAACLLILQYVSFKLSYDQFHQKADDIYRVVNDRYQNGKLIQHGTITYSAVGKALNDDFEEVMKNTRVEPSSGVIITHNDKKLNEPDLFYVENSFFDLFSFPLIAGDKQAILKAPYTLILSENLARKIFDYKGSDFNQFVGQSLKLNSDTVLYKIDGICKDVPINSHLKFNMLISYQSLISGGWKEADYDFTASDFWHYVQLKPNTDYKALNTKLAAFGQRHFQGNKISGSDEKFYLQPLAKAHLYSDFEYEIGTTASASVVWNLLIIALFIIILAWVNYINLSTARSIERAKEVGIRKVVGGYTSQLIGQFMTESTIVNIVSLVLAVVIVLTAQKGFNTLVQSDLSLSYLFVKGLSGYNVLLGLILMLILGIILSGFYPAFVLSSFQPITVLKGKMSHSKKGILLRKSLVVAQFSITIALIIGAMVVLKQVRFMKDKALGFNMEQMLIVNPPVLTQWDSTFINKINSFKEELKQLSAVKGAATSWNVPGGEMGRSFNIRANDSASNSTTMRHNGVDYDFMSVYGVKLLAGRQFNSTDHNANFEQVHNTIVNNIAVKLLGFASPEAAIGKQIKRGQKTWDIVGVVSDFHQKSLRFPLEPMFFMPNYSNSSLISIKLQPTNLSSTIESIKQKYTAFFPSNLFDYTFLDDRFNRQYQNEQLFGKIFNLFAALTIFVACLGLFGLAMFSTLQRTKEIGIRKVLGASVPNIIGLISKDFLVLVSISILIACPIAYYFMSKWLEDFAYRTTMSWWIFALAGVMAFSVALLTVSFQAIKAAVANPVKSLRTE